MADLTGQVFGRLTVLRPGVSAVSPKGYVRGRSVCQCQCGRVALVRNHSLKAGVTQSCGCYAAEVRDNLKKIDWERQQRKNALKEFRVGEPSYRRRFSLPSDTADIADAQSQRDFRAYLTPSQ